MKVTRTAAWLLLAAAPLSRADIAANFTGGSSYPGIADHGWLGGWAITTVDGLMANTVEDVAPVNASGSYLKIASSAKSDIAIGRRFETTGPNVDISQPLTIKFDLRIDTLTGWDSTNDYLSVHGNTAAAGATYNVSNLSSFIIRAFGASPAAGKNANEWLFYNDPASTGAGYSAANFVNSGMPIAANTTYSFTITIDPATKKYTASIFDGTNTVTTAAPCGWRSTAPGNSIAFNQKVNADGDSVGYSIDNVVVQSNVANGANVVADFTTTVDQYKGIAGLGWDAGWATTGSPAASVINTTPVNAGGNYLSVKSSDTSDSALAREFDDTGTLGGYDVTTDKIKTTFDLRVDTLTGWDTATDYLSVHGTRDPVNFNVSSQSSFIIRAFGASPDPGKNANEWLIYNGGADGGPYTPANFVNSGMPVVAGTTYTFTIINNPITKKSSGSISDGTNTVTWTDLGWRASNPSDRIAFNQRVSLATDVVSYSLDSIHIAEVGLTDFETWLSSQGITEGADGDDDHDGVTNAKEYAFGLLPKDGNSLNPITVPLDSTAGTFTYQRRDIALTGQSLTIWTSEDLTTWVKDDGAAQVAGTPDSNGVQQVAVTLSPALLSASKLFIQVRAK